MLRQTLIGIFALFFSLALLVAGNSMLGTAAALRLDIEGYRAGISGLVLACYSVGFVLGSIHGIKVIRRVGHIRAFAVFGAVAAAATLMHPLYVSPDSWMVFRVAVGFSIAGLMLVTESWINARATAETRGTLLSVYMVLFLLAAAAGQFSIALSDPALPQLFMFAAILVILSLVPLSLTRSPSPELEEGERIRVRTLWRITQVGTAGAVASGMVTAAFAAVGPIYASRMGLDYGGVGRFMGIAILVAMLLQWPVGYLSDVVRRHWMLAVVSAGAAGGALLAALTGGWSTLFLFASASMFYGLAACIYPLSLAVVHDRLAGRQLVPASATFLLSFGIGTIIGPVVAGIAVMLLGPAGLFLFVAAVLVTLVTIALRSPVHEEIPDVEDQEHCVTIVPVSTPVLMELDPRNQPDP